MNECVWYGTVLDCYWYGPGLAPRAGGPCDCER